MLTQGIYLYNGGMSNARVPPDKWIKILAFLRKCPDVRVGNEENCKRFIEAMMWMARAGAPWRMLPSEYGNWNSVYKRFARWSERGVWQRMHDAFIEEPDMAFIIIDSADSEGEPSGGWSVPQKGRPGVPRPRKEQGRVQHENPHSGR